MDFLAFLFFRTYDGLESLWSGAPQLVPIAVLIVLILSRFLGLPVACLPPLRASVESLMKDGDVMRAFPSSRRRMSVEQLISGDSRSFDGAMARTDELFGRLYGTSIWTPIAFSRSLGIALLYPVAMLLIVWVATGVGDLWGEAILTPASKFERVVFLSVVVGFLALGFTQSRGAGVAGAAGAMLAFGTVTLFGDGDAGSNIALVAFSIAYPSAIVGLRFGYSLQIPLVIGLIAVGVPLNSFIDSGEWTPANKLALAIATAVLFGWFAGASLGKKLSKWHEHRKLAARLDVQKIVAWPKNEVAMMMLAISASFGAIYFYAKFLPLVIGEIRPDSIASKSYFFVLFLCILPVWNALVDMLSVGITRSLMRINLGQKAALRWFAMVFLDVLFAFALTLLLFWGLFEGLRQLESFGWAIEADSIVRAFNNDKGSGESLWIFSMALTNFLPTVVHLGIAFRGIVAGVLWRDDGFADMLKENRGALSRPQAQKLVNWVYIDRWITAFAPAALTIALLPYWAKLLAAII